MTNFAPYMPERFSEITLTVNDAAITRGYNILFENLGFEAVSGDLLWIVGANGSGKTSLLRLCAGLLVPDAGEVNITAEIEQAAAYQPHRGFAKAGLTLQEDFDFWREVYGATDSDVLSALGVDAARNTRTEHLSAGQKRRLALAKLCVSGCPIWLMDEPMAGLDVAGRALVSGLVSAHLSRGGIALIASHNPANINAQSVRRLTLEAA